VNTKRVNAAAGVIHAARVKGKRTAAGIAADLESACLLQSPETAAEQAQLRDDITGACLARWEEEQENARLRRALKSAQRGRRELRELVRQMCDALNGYDCPPPGETPMQLVTRVSIAWSEAEARVAALLAERHVTNKALSDAAEALRADRDRIAELEKREADGTEYAVQYPDGQTVMAETVTRVRARAEASLRAHLEIDSQLWAECRIVQRSVAHGEWVEASADGITRRIAPTQALREDAYVSPLHHDYRIGRDLPEPDGAP
jgi:hypothetical protein